MQCTIYLIDSENIADHWVGHIRLQKCVGQDNHFLEQKQQEPIHMVIGYIPRNVSTRTVGIHRVLHR